jgi:hypothetical protein
LRRLLRGLRLGLAGSGGRGTGCPALGIVLRTRGQSDSDSEHHHKQQRFLFHHVLLSQGCRFVKRGVYFRIMLQVSSSFCCVILVVNIIKIPGTTITKHSRIRKRVRTHKHADHAPRPGHCFPALSPHCFAAAQQPLCAGASQLFAIALQSSGYTHKDTN